MELDQAKHQTGISGLFGSFTSLTGQQREVGPKLRDDGGYNWSWGDFLSVNTDGLAFECIFHHNELCNLVLLLEVF